MSRDMDICCMRCSEYLWIGQTDTIYSGEPNTMEALRQFLVKHRTYTTKAYDPDNYHELLFMPEPYNGSFEEIEWKEWDANDFKDDAKDDGSNVVSGEQQTPAKASPREHPDEEQ